MQCLTAWRMGTWAVWGWMCMRMKVRGGSAVGEMMLMVACIKGTTWSAAHAADQTSSVVAYCTRMTYNNQVAYMPNPTVLCKWKAELRHGWGVNLRNGWFSGPSLHEP
eukprot:33067-Pelagomonas_calceolata.AAC.7